MPKKHTYLSPAFCHIRAGKSACTRPYVISPTRTYHSRGSAPENPEQASTRERLRRKGYKRGAQGCLQG